MKNAPLEAVDMLIFADAAFSPPVHEYKIAEIQNKVSSGEYTQENRVSRQTDSFYKEIMDWLEETIEKRPASIPDLPSRQDNGETTDNDSGASEGEQEEAGAEDGGSQEGDNADAGSSSDEFTPKLTEEIKGSHLGAMKLYEKIRSAEDYQLFGKGVSDWNRESMMDYARSAGSDVRGDGLLYEIGDRLVNYTPEHGGMTVVFYPGDQVNYSCSVVYSDRNTELGCGSTPVQIAEYPLLAVTYESLFASCGAEDVMRLASEHALSMSGNDGNPLAGWLYYDLGDGRKLSVGYFSEMDYYQIVAVDETGREIEVGCAAGRKGLITYILYDQGTLSKLTSASNARFFVVSE